MSWRLSPRAARRGDARWWLSAAVIAGSAATVAYLLDPDRGRSRRTRIAERTSHIVRTTGRRVARRVRYLSSSMSKRVKHLIVGAPQTYAEGRILLDRVESELFKDPGIPHGLMNLEADGTTVVLRGQLESEEQIDRIETAVRRIPGVGNVKNLLHRPGTPAPNKLAALLVSAEASGQERWPEEPPPDVDEETPLAASTSRIAGAKEG
jgi:BON domain-containing protein